MSSRASLVIASGARQSRLYLSSPAQQFCHREGRSDLGCPGLANREKRDASQARLYLSSRGTWRSLLFRAGEQSKERLLRRLAMTLILCHREGRSDLACHPFLSKHPMGITRNNSVIASVAWQNVVIASVARQSRLSALPLSSRGTKRSRFFMAGRTRKERLLRRLAMTVILCHREGRSDLGCPGLANNQKRDCRAALAMTNAPVIARNVAISVVRGWSNQKREIAALRSQ